jgi:hypothetical protein
MSDRPTFQHNWQREGHTPLADFEVTRFEYVPAALVLRLTARLALSQASLANLELVVERGAHREEISPQMGAAQGAGADALGRVLWRGTFPAAHELALDPLSRFILRWEELALTLPKPSVLTLISPAPASGELLPALRPYAMRKKALLFVVSCQVGLAPALSSSNAFAADGAGSPGTTEGAQEAPAPEAAGETHTEESSPPPAEGAKSGETGGEEKPSSPAAPEEKKAEAESPKPGSAPPEAPPQHAPETPAQTPPAAPGHDVGAPHATQPTSTLQLPVPNDGGQSRHHAGSSDSESRSAAPRDVRKPGEHRRKGHRDGAAHAHVTPPGPAGVSSTPAGSFLEVPQPLVELPPGVTTLTELQPPAYLLPIYKEAGHRYGVPWRVLAAINQVESNYGRNLSVSSAGAVGWMQFMPATWQEWAVEADGDNQANPYSPRDAIFTAARYLQASGAETDLHGAIFAYNHADWYVAEVLFRARTIDTSSMAFEKGYALPLERRYMRELGRTDDGVDIELAPDGAVVYSMTPGVVTAVASDPAGFGPNYPVIEATSGSLAGQRIYYGHVAQSLVVPGQHVAAGEPIAIMGHTGDAASLGQGHIEIGFSDAGGDPLSHHGESAWTPAGEIMHEFLVSLSAAFKIHNG